MRRHGWIRQPNGEIFWLITLPMMAPIILLNLIYTVVDSFTDASNPVVAYIYQIGFEGPSQFEFASAMSWFYFPVCHFVGWADLF